MKKQLFYSLLFFIIFFFNSYSQNLLIFGGDNHDVFLGCLNCSKYESNSIWNEYGTYGSKYSSTSIWNEYSTYSGKYSSNSPFNSYASNPPVIVDKEGNFYGYFTANKYASKATQNKLALFIIDYWESIKEDVGEYYDKIFN